MKIVVLVLTALLVGATNSIAQSPDPSALPDGVYVQSFEFRPVFRAREEEKEWSPTNGTDVRPRQGTMGTRSVPSRDPSMETLRGDPPKNVMALKSTCSSRIPAPEPSRSWTGTSCFWIPSPGSN